jgi:hypothetical protein
MLAVRTDEMARGSDITSQFSPSGYGSYWLWLDTVAPMKPGVRI